MDCICCGSDAVTERPEVTAQGYRRFRCRDCGRSAVQRAQQRRAEQDQPAQRHHRVRGVLPPTLSPDPARPDEILLLRGIEVSYEAVRDWETKLLPIMGEELRKRRRGKRRVPGASWYVDETYLKVRGKWAYLYRAIDRDGNLVDAMLSEHRDMAAAKAFFRSAKATTGFRPDRVTTDGHGSYPRAIRMTLGRTVWHRTSAYLNNRLEQDHRGIKGRIRCMRASSPISPPVASAESTANSVIFFVAAFATTSPFPPSLVALDSPKPPALRSTSCKPPDPPRAYQPT
jgi:putative transposase